MGNLIGSPHYFHLAALSIVRPSWVRTSAVIVLMMAHVTEAQKTSSAFGSSVVGDPAMTDNIRKFQELYGFATQLMNLGGNILNKAGGSGGTAQQQNPSSSYNSYYRGNNDEGNGILGEVRPQLRGIPAVESSSYDGATKSEPSPGMLSNLFSGYGGGPLGAGSRSQPKSILDTLMGTFLGSSIGSSGAPAPNFFSPSIEESSRFGDSKQGSNIEALVNALSQSGAKRADSDSEDAGPTSFLSQFFGGGKK